MPDRSGTPPRADHFPLFDALRAIAAVGVMTYHGVYLFAVYGGVGGPEWWRYAMHLDVGVPVFLAISGFLLYRPFVAARAGGGPLPSVRAYGWRRVLRIVPAYWFALTVLTLWFWWQPPGFEEVRSPGGVLRFYGFAQVYDGDTAIAGIGQAWTLCVEVVFYALLPVWALAMRRFRPGLRSEAIGIAAWIAFSLAWKVVVLARLDPSDPSSLPWLLSTPAYMDHLALGMLLAVVSVHVARERPSWRWLRLVERRPAVPWALALAAFLCACWIAGPDGSLSDRMTDRMYFERHVFFGLTALFLLVPAVFGDPEVGGVRRFLAWRPLVYVGTVSFSFYLFHYAVLDQLQHSLGRGPERGWELLPWWLAALAGSVVLGTIGYRLVERPSMRAARRIAPARPGSEPAGTVAAQVHAAP